MGFTIEDMMVVSADRYRMKLIAGHKGWSNSISWLLMLEDLRIIRHFSGKELAVTTGLGFPKEQDLLNLTEELYSHNASGLIVNTGFYVNEIPESVSDFCDQNDFPLLTVPWEVLLLDMIKDLSIRILLQSGTDEQISGALIQAIESPDAGHLYAPPLRPYFDLDGTFQIALVSTGDLDSMDTVERKRIAYRMQLYLTNLTHNGHFFYYDSFYVIVINALTEDQNREILSSFAARIRQKMPEKDVVIGVSDMLRDIRNLRALYKRAAAAAQMARATGQVLTYFSEMGIYRLLYLVDDSNLLKEFSEKPLSPLIAYDREHGTEYIKTLSVFLKTGGSIKAMAEEMHLHRNTVMYRMTQIRTLLKSELEEPRERMVYMTACMIREMGLGDR